MGQIVPVKRLEAEIAACKDIGKLTEIKDKAEALRIFFKRAKKGFEKANQYAELKIRAERQCGTILASEVKHGGNRKSESRFDRRTLKDLGINKNQSHCWQVLANWPARVFEKHIAETKESNQELTSIAVYRAANAYRRARKQDLKPVPNAESVKTPIHFKLITGDFRDHIDKFQNIDAIITDPPYAKKHLGLYEDLARFAGKVLKPSGSLLTMAIVRYLPDILDLMRPHIGYHHVISYYMPAQLRREWDKKVFIRWKAILWFVKGKYEGGWVKNVVKASAIEKGLHPWQQPSGDFEKLIEKITHPGDTVIDPFFGSGSLGEAAIKLNRQLIGIDIDQRAIEIAEKRLERFAKKIVVRSFIQNANPGEVIQNWENQEDSFDSNEMPEKPLVANGSKHHEHTKHKSKTNKAPAKKKSVAGFGEWVDKTFSICTGCENDCIYCWAKKDAIRFKRVLPGKWKEMIIRQHHVDKNHPKYGRVAFPSTHDILPFNIDAYLLVLRKLLDAGNEVLIVSKPRIDCIKSICEAAKAFKEKILFRFSIGALDDDILSFWEPNAPSFSVRAECLKYALDQGFGTSVSTEPMLQSYAIDGMVHKLLPLVSDAMWIGKMNYLGQLKKKADETLMARITEIEQGQTDERIWAIYNKYKDNPKIKWKDSIKKVVGLKAPSKPGMDV